MALSIPFKSVILLVGPQKSGKTTFAKEQLIPQLKCRGVNIGYISSNDERQIFSHGVSKRDRCVSKTAFESLKIRLIGLLRFESETDFIIVDSRGLDQQFRENIADIAKQYMFNCCAIVFYYNPVSIFYDLLKKTGEISDSIQRKTDNDIKRTQETLKHIGKNIPIMYCIEKLDKYDIKISDEEDYFKSLYKEGNYLIIGDVHCCVDEVQKLIAQVNKECTPVFVGDIIDKGGDVRCTIDYFYKNCVENHNFIIVEGNHDRAVYDLLTGKKTENLYKLGFIEKYYNSYCDIKGDGEYTEKFLKIHSTMIPFFRYDGDIHGFYVVHAPCSMKYVGKLDKISIQHQRYMATDHSTTDGYEQVSKFFLPDSKHHPKILCGHIPLDKPYIGWHNDNNYVMLDTGCVYGNKLTGMLIEQSGQSKLYSVPFSSPFSSCKDPLKTMKCNIIDTLQMQKVYDNLDPGYRKRIENMISNGVNYVSGTICPVDKSEHSLETLEKGFEYFKKMGVDIVVIQPKYMGSRCQMILHKDGSGYLITRNGFIFNQLTETIKSDLLKQQLTRLQNLFDQKNLSTVIIDGELMPWSVMGKGLIDDFYQTSLKCIERELASVRDTGLEQKLKDLQGEIDATDFMIDQNSMKKEDMIKKYNSKYSTFKQFLNLRSKFIPIEEREKMLQIYREQIQIFGEESPVHYKPFSILKMITKDGDETIPGVINEDTSFTQEQLFRLVSDDQIIVVNLSDPDSVSQGVEFYKSTIASDLEGVMIKPLLLSTEFAPMLKCRNEKYLTLVYGYDYLYPAKYNQLILNKRINKKLKSSINEFKLGLEMLRTKIDNLNSIEYRYILSKFLNAEQDGSTIDPRL